MASTIFKATYSGVPVYEMPCKGVAVMRRRADSWINATQILKVAGFDKPQRTRVLEREVQKGTHEKVQGGYGKYQGTWVPMDRGIALSQQYGVDHLLQPIFDFVPTQDSPPQAPKHLTAAPATRTKKTPFESNKVRSAARRSPSPSTPLLPPPDIPQDRDSPAPSEEKSLSPTPSDGESEPSRTPSPIMEDGDSDAGPGKKKGKKRKRKAPAAQGPVPDFEEGHNHKVGSEAYGNMMLDYFVSESTQIPAFLINPPPDFDPNVPIDDDGHTALHWAAAMGRIRVVRLLLTAGADIFRTNISGQTPLMRSVMFSNNYDLRKFPELFELLQRSTINLDKADRTVFHYIVDIALQKGKTHAARYYATVVLERLSAYPPEVASILNFQDEDGETALTLAARARSKRLVKILLDYGADPRIVNRDGKSAEDYILEDQRYRAPSAGPHSGVHVPGLGPYIPQLHYSETGQRISGRCIPQMVEMLENLAHSFDTELEEKERDLSQATSLLTNIRTEILESQRKVIKLKMQAKQLDVIEMKEKELEAKLKEKIGARFRLGWEKYIRDEDARTKDFLQNGDPSDPRNSDLIDILKPRDSPTLRVEEETLKRDLKDLRLKRDNLTDMFVTLQKESGSTEKMNEMKKVISLGCAVDIKLVDTLVDELILHKDDGIFGLGDIDGAGELNGGALGGMAMEVDQHTLGISNANGLGTATLGF
ncbi:apses-domain-containing protein [Atractiella rhizophila]|nr:apses-domain-containing protein [Atractiella rhizophila]